MEMESRIFSVTEYIRPSDGEPTVQWFWKPRTQQLLFGMPILGKK